MSFCVKKINSSRILEEKELEVLIRKILSRYKIEVQECHRRAPQIMRNQYSTLRNRRGPFGAVIAKIHLEGQSKQEMNKIKKKIYDCQKSVNIQIPLMKE